MVKARFESKSRLRRPAEFKHVFSGSKRIKSPHFALLVSPNKLGRPRLGMSISKKKVGTSVARNRIKRIARESFRNIQCQLTNSDIVLVAYNGIADLSKKELRKNLDLEWIKLSKT
jgi:ribonuclease P protein component